MKLDFNKYILSILFVSSAFMVKSSDRTSFQDVFRNVLITAAVASMGIDVVSGADGSLFRTILHTGALSLSLQNDKITSNTEWVAVLIVSNQMERSASDFMNDRRNRLANRNRQNANRVPENNDNRNRQNANTRL